MPTIGPGILEALNKYQLNKQMSVLNRSSYAKSLILSGQAEKRKNRYSILFKVWIHSKILTCLAAWGCIKEDTTQ